MPVNALSGKGPNDQNPKHNEDAPIEEEAPSESTPKEPYELTETELAHREIDHLWEQTEVIDMDTW